MRLLLLVILAIFAQVAKAQPGHLRAVDLRTESLPHPLAIDTPRPRLSWTLEADRRAERQTAYAILVATSRDLLAQDRGDLWNSGRVESGATAHVEYGGKPIRSRTQGFWKVRGWDRDGHPGEWSEPAAFEVGLTEPTDWSAEWIDATPGTLPAELVKAEYRTHDGRATVDVTSRITASVARGEPLTVTNTAMGGDPLFGTPKVLVIDYSLDGAPFRIETPENGVAEFPPRSIPYLRKDFAIEAPLLRARLHVTALGVYDAFLNGRRIGDHRLAPGWTDYRARLQSQTFDVTALVRQGQNTLGAIVGPGWFCGRAGLFHARAFYGQSPALLAQLELHHADGSLVTVTSDSTWIRHDGPTLMADLMDGEVFDARRELAPLGDASPHAWCMPEPPATGPAWTLVKTRVEARTIRPQPDQPVRTLAELPGKSVTQPAPGRFVFDLGQNMVGVTRIRVREPRGTRITLRHTEMLNADGTLYTANLRGAGATDIYICRGGEEEVWEPRFTFHGFRYVELGGLSVTPSPTTVTGIVLGTDLPQVGTFTCSDPR
ncbi:MAG: family 78 glycoside hydrolase catalytic domain, partial [Phycisphaerales bacterium]